MTRLTHTRAVLVIAGPTASGKTAAALELARRLGGELVGADSVQVYRGFDIGAAKPTEDELRGVRHHLIDVADATRSRKLSWSRGCGPEITFCKSAVSPTVRVRTPQ